MSHSDDPNALHPEVENAIQTDLAPAVAVALLAKADRPEESDPPALKCIGAGVVEGEDDTVVRIQFMFDNGTVLPIEVPRDVGVSLSRGLDAAVAK